MNDIIYHIIIIINILTLAAGFTAFFLYMYVYLLNHVMLIKYYLAVQVCMIFWSLIAVFHPYIMENLNGSIQFLIFIYVLHFPLTAFFFYYCALFYHNLTDTPFYGIKKTIYKVIAITCVMAVSVPFLTRRTSEGILYMLGMEHHFITFPLCLIIDVISIYLMISGYKKIKNKIVHAVIKTNIVLYLGMVPLIIIFFLTIPPAEKVVNNFVIIIPLSVFFFLWHVISIVLFIIFARRISHVQTPSHRRDYIFPGLATAAVQLSDSLENYRENNTARARELTQRMDRFKKRYSITDRQYEVVELLLNGLSNQEISAKLGVSRRTVETHILSIYNKLSVNNRIELFNIAVEFQLIMRNDKIIA